MSKFKNFILNQFFSDNLCVNSLGLIILVSLGFYIFFFLYRSFVSIFKFFIFPKNPPIAENKPIHKKINDKDAVIDYVVMEQPKYYICSYCGSKYRYFQTNCDNCGAIHIDFIKKNN